MIRLVFVALLAASAGSIHAQAKAYYFCRYENGAKHFVSDIFYTDNPSKMEAGKADAMESKIRQQFSHYLEAGGYAKAAYVLCSSDPGDPLEYTTFTQADAEKARNDEIKLGARPVPWKFDSAALPPPPAPPQPMKGKGATRAH